MSDTTRRGGNLAASSTTENTEPRFPEAIGNDDACLVRKASCDTVPLGSGSYLRRVDEGASWHWLYEPPPARPKKNGESEAQVETRTRWFLNRLGLFVKKHSVQACHACGALPSTTQGLGKGASDLVAIVDGRFLAIEMKRPGYSASDVSQEQRRFLAEVRKHGGVSGVASSEQEAEALVNEARAR
jgi:hypothetical protein